MAGGDADPSADPDTGVVVRPAAGTDPDADGDETVAVCRVLEGALLDVDFPTVERAVAAGDAFVAVREGAAGAGESGSVVGALVRTWPANAPADEAATDRSDRARVEAVAVRPAWRGRGVGRALVEAATGPAGLVATFRPSVRGFYESLGFEVTTVGSAGGDDGDGRDWDEVDDGDGRDVDGDDTRLRGRRSPDGR